MNANETDILIIGGGPAGVVAAVNARKNYPKKRISLIREKEQGIVPCGIPYIFNRLDSVEKDLMSDKGMEMNNVDLLIDRAIKLDAIKKKVFLRKGKELSYDKLILATGSKPSMIPIKGIDLAGTFVIEKEFEYLKRFREAVLNSKNIVIIGGGFIGVELAEEMSRIKGLRISIIEKLEHCLIATFDEDFAVSIEEELKKDGIEIYNETSVEEIGGKDKVEFVKVKNKKIPADIVVLSVGAKPNVELAKEAGIKIGKSGAIEVNEYMETSIKDVFAIGDCAEKKDLLTKRYASVMLASTACHEARIAAYNLYEKSSIKNDGTLTVFSTCVNKLAIGSAGLNERKAKEEGIEIVTGESKAMNHHPATLKDTQGIRVKLIFSKDSGKILGGEISGGESVGEMINAVALAIQKGADASELIKMQIATHPLLTSAPTEYPLISAAQSAMFKMNHK